MINSLAPPKAQLSADGATVTLSRNAWSETFPVKPEPVMGEAVVRGEVVLYWSKKHGRSWIHAGRDSEACRLTLPTADGAPIPGTYTSADGDVIKIEQQP
ncbi:MAG: hypothetical protein IPM06_21075 [Rhizobiales bacterium]|nr:hypothetical protein [Hyphomicrobiales bacterium]